MKGAGGAVECIVAKAPATCQLSWRAWDSRAWLALPLVPLGTSYHGWEPQGTARGTQHPGTHSHRSRGTAAVTSVPAEPCHFITFGAGGKSPVLLQMGGCSLVTVTIVRPSSG